MVALIATMKKTMLAVDLMIHAGWVIPVEPRDTIYSQHTVVIQQGRIVDLLPTEVATREYRAEVELQRPGHALLPGFINTHTHAAMSLMRGLADDLPLMSWLNDHIWPAEAKWVSRDFVRDGTELAIAEMVRSGTTCFNDMYFFPDETAKVAEQAGIRAVVGLIVIDFPTVWAQDADEYIHKGLEIHEQLRHNPLITTAFAPHAPYTVSNGALERIAMYAEELDTQIHMHIHETHTEVEQGLEQHGMRPLQRLDELGLLSPRTIAVHMTQLTEEEISRYAAAGGHLAHCPESNLKLASGFSPITQLTQAGVNCALGTDGSASNNDLDMLGEMRSAALLAKGVSGDASALNAMTALEMATINGAKALGLDHVCGSLAIGKSADLIAIDLDQLETQPTYHPISQIVYAANRHQITDVWVAGNHLLKDRHLTQMDEDQILANTKLWQQKLAPNS